MPHQGLLFGRRFIITGAARGMGKAIAELFWREGARLVLCDIETDAVHALALTLNAKSYSLDVSNERDVQAMLISVGSHWAGLEGVVNAAGILRKGPVETFDSDQFLKLLQVNVLGPYHVCRAALPLLRLAATPTIVNIASISALRPAPTYTGYCASKAALLAMTRNLAVELAPLIRANTICPGIIKTEMTRELWETEAAEQMSSAGSALKRLGTPEEIARLALFLSSEASSYTTGAAFTADGGISWH